MNPLQFSHSLDFSPTDIARPFVAFRKRLDWIHWIVWGQHCYKWSPSRDHHYSSWFNCPSHPVDSLSNRHLVSACMSQAHEALLTAWGLGCATEATWAGKQSRTTKNNQRPRWWRGPLGDLLRSQTVLHRSLAHTFARGLLSLFYRLGTKIKWES